MQQQRIQQFPNGSTADFWKMALTPASCWTPTLSSSTIWPWTPQPARPLVRSTLFADWTLQILAELVVKWHPHLIKLRAIQRYYDNIMQFKSKVSFVIFTVFNLHKHKVIQTVNWFFDNTIDTNVVEVCENNCIYVMSI